MLTFLVIGGCGILLLLVSLILGDLFGGAFDIAGDLFSSAALAGFLGAFGFAGALAYDLTDNTGTGILVGLVAGVAIGAAVGWAVGKLKEGGDESNVRTSELTGRQGTVVSAIPEDGYGEVTVVVAGHITKLNARSNAPLASGTSVIIMNVLSSTAVQVERLT